MLYTILFIIISSIYFGFSIFYYRKKQQFPNITGPRPLPIIGNALPLAFKPVHHALAEITRKWGSIYLMWLGTKPIIILNEPEMIKNVLQTNSSSFQKGFFSDIVKPLMGDGLLTSEGEMWKLHHKLANSGFQASRYKESLPLIADRVFALIAKWDKSYIANSTPFDIYSEFSRLTLDNIGIAAFGGDFGAINSDDTCIFDEVAIILKEMQKRAEQLYPIYKLYPSFLTNTFDVSNNKIHSIVRNKIKNRKNSGDTKKCLLDTMLDAQPIFNMSDKEIEDEMITWVMGGHETTASLISWTLYLLYKNKNCLNKVRQEAQFSSTIPSYEELNKMEYLTCVLKETLRMYPPAPLLNRVSIETVDIGGYVLPPNTEVLICPWTLHYENFEDSKKFQPERFLEGDKYGYNYLPFGGGPRACLGKLFAFFEAKLVVSMIVSRIEFEIMHDEEVDSEVAITLRPKNGIVCKAMKCK